MRGVCSMTAPQLVLLPCPFCGNEHPDMVQFPEESKPNWRVVCLPCLHSNRESEAAAQSAWNRRAGVGPASPVRDPAPPDFKGVDQTEDGCWFACIASLTGIPLGDFPPPPADENGVSAVHNAVTKLLHAHGWQMHRLWTIPDAVPRGWAIAGGTSPRNRMHSVVVYDGVMVWDPHPSRAGLVTIEEYEILVPVRAGNALPRVRGAGVVPPLTTAMLAAALDDVLATTAWEGKGASLASSLFAALRLKEEGNETR